jgi:ankyrin repeat protein
MTDPRADFIEASFWHGSLERAEAILAAHPEIASSDIHTAAILGDDVAVRRFLKINPASATEKIGPRDVDALTYLCFSTYLQRDHARGDGFVRAATALLDAGASANTGFYDVSHKPSPEWESVLYGAAGVAHHAAMTRLLLERGANPNDEEVVYHSPETYDNAAMKLLVETGRLTEDSLTLMLIRKHDWHDYEGVKYLLQQGIDVNRDRLRGWRPLHHAIARDNALAIIELLLDRDADPMQPQDGQTAAALAARRGRGDVLSLFDRRQRAVEFSGVDRIVAACARHDADAVRNTSARHPELKHALIADGGKVLVEFAANGNTPGVELLLDLGVPVTALHTQGDGYWDLAKNTTALHAAAWRAQHDTVQLLIARGAEVDAKDAKGRTALAQAVRACVDSYWTSRRSPDSVAALLRAGASIAGVKYPSGYSEVDELLRQHGARA